MSKNRLVLVVLIIMAMIAGVFGYQTFSKNNKNTNAGPSVNLAGNSNSTAIVNSNVNQTSGVNSDSVIRKTYTNTPYGFVFQYPSTWSLFEAKNCRNANPVNMNCSDGIVNLSPPGNSTPPRFVSLSYLGDIEPGSNLNEWRINRGWSSWSNDFSVNGIPALSLQKVSKESYAGSVLVDVAVAGAVLQVEWFDNGQPSTGDFGSFVDVLYSLRLEVE